MTDMPTEEQRARCANCGRAIIWYFDRDDDAQGTLPFGIWYNAETMTDACGGPDGDPVDDMWHEPDATIGR